MQGQNLVEVEVRDTGSGIRPEVLERMFEPFFSTKEVGKGSGMGLATVHGIVHEYGGHIAVETAPGRGTQFRILLPALAQDKGQVSGPARARTGARKTPPRLTGRVLVVEDERLVAEFMGELLKTWGLKVTVKTNPVEAYELVARDPAGFDLMITDQTMPKLTGLELACRVTEVRPELPVILYTGYSENLEQDQLARCGVCALIRKPLDPTALMNALARQPACEQGARLARLGLTRHNDDPSMKSMRRLASDDPAYRQVLGSQSKAVLLMDRELRVCDCNAQALALFHCSGKRSSADPASTWCRRGSPTEPIRSRRCATAVAAAFGGLPQSLLCYVSAVDQSCFEALVQIEAVELDGRPHILAQVRDLTRLRQAEQALEASELRLRQLLDNTPTVVFIRDLDGRYIYVNRRFCRDVRQAAERAGGLAQHRPAAARSRRDGQRQHRAHPRSPRSHGVRGGAAGGQRADDVSRQPLSADGPARRAVRGVRDRHRHHGAQAHRAGPARERAAVPLHLQRLGGRHGGAR